MAETQAIEVLGDFRLDRKLGAGGMGIVYLATQVSLDRQVAVKVLPRELAHDPDFAARFEREAKAAAKLQHPNIVQVHSAGITEGRPWFAMEFVEGKDISVRLRAGERFSYRRSAEIAREVALALQEASEAGIVHRDIKPANIMIDKRGRVRVMDFGLARASSGPHLTQTGTIMGTPHYMSPEQGKGAAVDTRSDLYSLGVVLYEMVVGKPPFDADTSSAIIFQHVYEPPPPIRERRPDAPPELIEIIGRFLQKKPEDRYQTPQEAADALDRFLRATETAAGTATRPDEATMIGQPAAVPATGAAASGEVRQPTLKVSPPPGAVPAPAAAAPPSETPAIPSGGHGSGLFWKIGILIVCVAAVWAYGLRDRWWPRGPGEPSGTGSGGTPTVAHGGSTGVEPSGTTGGTPAEEGTTPRPVGGEGAPSHGGTGAGSQAPQTGGPPVVPPPVALRLVGAPAGSGTYIVDGVPLAGDETEVLAGSHQVEFRPGPGSYFTAPPPLRVEAAPGAGPVTVSMPLVRGIARVEVAAATSPAGPAPEGPRTGSALLWLEDRPLDLPVVLPIGGGATDIPAGRYRITATAEPGNEIAGAIDPASIDIHPGDRAIVRVPVEARPVRWNDGAISVRGLQLAPDAGGEGSEPGVRYGRDVIAGIFQEMLPDLTGRPPDEHQISRLLDAVPAERFLGMAGDIRVRPDGAPEGEPPPPDGTPPDDERSRLRRAVLDADLDEGLVLDLLVDEVLSQVGWPSLLITPADANAPAEAAVRELRQALTARGFRLVDPAGLVDARRREEAAAAARGDQAALAALAEDAGVEVACRVSVEAGANRVGNAYFLGRATVSLVAYSVGTALEVAAVSATIDPARRDPDHDAWAPRDVAGTTQEEAIGAATRVAAGLAARDLARSLLVWMVGFRDAIVEVRGVDAESAPAFEAYVAALPGVRSDSVHAQMAADGYLRISLRLEGRLSALADYLTAQPHAFDVRLLGFDRLVVAAR